MPAPSPRLVVLLSGSGSTLQNLLDRCADGRLAAEVVGVVSSRADVFGVERARRAGVPVVIAEKAGRSETAFAAARNWAADLVVCAGWIHLLNVPPDFRGRVLNVHPSLLPKFGGKGMYGRHVHEAVLAAGETESGCTVHLVDDTYDTGPLVLQRRVPVLPGDTPEMLAERVQAAEREALPEGIEMLLKRSHPPDLLVPSPEAGADPCDAGGFPPMNVYLLWHVNKLPGGEEDSKLIGVYASDEAAEQARERVSGQPGFRDSPEGFQVSRYEVGRDHWTEGFVTVTHESLLRQFGSEPSGDHSK